MKKNLIFLLVAVGTFTLSCKKIDFPLPQKLCQIKQIIHDGGPTVSGAYDYTFNNKRLVTEIIFRFAYQTGQQLEYDNHDRLITIHQDSFVTNKLIYQNGLVVRIDRFDNNDQLFDQIFFTYDQRKRLVQRNGVNPELGFISYEYIGHSRNIKRKVFYGPPITGSANKEFDESISKLAVQDRVVYRIYEYEYDNKINPHSTLIGLPFNPFFFGEEDPIDLFEPIPENNIVHQKFWAISAEVPYNFMDYFSTYEYENLYPVKASRRKIYAHNPLQIFFSTATYTYECKN